MATATWLIAAGYVLVFLVLSAQAGQAAQRSIWLFGKGVAAQRIPALLFRLAFAGAVLGYPAAIMLGADGSWSSQVWPASLAVLGNVLAAAGTAMALAAQVYMARSWRIGAADGELGEFIDTGPFGLSRNPVFVGQIVLFCGLALAMADLFHLILLLGAAIAIWRQVGVEEAVLAASLGERYREYCQRVRRWI